MRTLALALLLSASAASAQPLTAPQVCSQSLACQQQRVADLLDYRAWLEDQLALAKSLARELQQQVQQKAEELKACEPKALPPR